MKQSQFIRQRNQQWQDFEQLLEADSTADSWQFPASYRQLCYDLSLARSRQYNPQLIARLNMLVDRGQQKLYRHRSSGWQELYALFGSRALVACYQFRYWIWASLLVFFGLGLIAALAVIMFPDLINWFIQPSQLRELSSMYDPAGSAQIQKREAESDVLMFGYYIYHNIGIAFQTFAGGVLFCVGALFYLLFNAFYLGAISGYMVNLGYSQPFFSFVIGHGSVELTAIALSGAAGCRMGYALLVPGCYRRLVALKLIAPQVLPILAMAFIMLLLAAGIEAFWSPRDIPAAIKYVVGSFLWLAVSYWLYRGTVRGA